MKRAVIACAVAWLVLAASPALAQNNVAGGPGNSTANATAPGQTAPKPAPADDQSAANAAQKQKKADAAVNVDATSKASLTALMKLFVLAAVVESALALLFNWAPFVAFFNGRGVKSMISLGASWILVATFKVDVVHDLMTVYGGGSDVQSTPFSLLISAMVVAGGSGGVNHLLRTLGLREVVTTEQPAPKPAPTNAWIAVAFRKRLIAVGPVYVEISQNAGPFETAGTIDNPSTMSNAIRYFVRDPGRLPPSGGRDLPPGTPIQVQLRGVNSAGVTITSAVPWSSNGLLAGAIVDIDLSL